MFPEPRPNVPYLETYGAFFLHCGFTAMGVPGKSDTHPLHGELPNAAYAEAHLVLGQDDKGAYLGLGGRYQHAAAFSSTTWPSRWSSCTPARRCSEWR